MKFYHNNGLNLTAEEDWVIDYLIESGQAENRAEARAELQDKWEYCGWYECEVSNTIEEALRYGKSTY